MSLNSCTVKPVKDVKSNGFLDSLSYESKKEEETDELLIITAVYSNYARDLDYEEYNVTLTAFVGEPNTSNPS